MRLIDADALRKAHCEDCAADVKADCEKDPICSALMWVDEAPTIDAVEVVRCKDCIWYEPDRDDEWIGCYFDTELKDDRPNADDFCSRGERRTDVV